MSIFKVNLLAVNIQDPSRITPLVEVVVDTGAELTWLPQALLEQAGIAPQRQRNFYTATKQLIQRPVGYAVLRAEGYETIDEVVFAEKGDMSLLGVRTLEGFGVAVDNIGHRFIAQAALAA